MLLKTLCASLLSLIVFVSPVLALETQMGMAGMGNCALPGFRKVSPYTCLAIDDGTLPLPAFSIFPPDSVCTNLNWAGSNAYWNNVDTIYVGLNVSLASANAVGIRSGFLLFYTDAGCTNVYNDVTSFNFVTKEYVATPGNVEIHTDTATLWLPVTNGRTYYDDSWDGSTNFHKVTVVIYGYIERH